MPAEKEVYENGTRDSHRPGEEKTEKCVSLPR